MGGSLLYSGVVTVNSPVLRWTVVGDLRRVKDDFTLVQYQSFTSISIYKQARTLFSGKVRSQRTHCQCDKLCQNSACVTTRSLSLTLSCRFYQEKTL